MANKKRALVESKCSRVPGSDQLFQVSRMHQPKSDPYASYYHQIEEAFRYE